MRMRQQKESNQLVAETSDLLSFLERYKPIFKKMKDVDLKHAVSMFTNGKQTISMEEFEHFALGLYEVEEPLKKK